MGVIILVSTEINSQQQDPTCTWFDDVLLYDDSFQTKMSQAARETDVKKIDLHTDPSISPQGLSQILANIPFNLRILILNLQKQWVGDDHVKLFAQKHFMQNLEHVSLNLQRSKVTSEGIEAIAQNLPKLRVLQLLLPGENMSEGNFETLGRQLNKMKGLELLHLDVAESLVSSHALCKIFVLFPNVQQLAINLKKTNLDDPSLSKFKDTTIQYCKSLTTFIMDISETKVTDIAVRLLLISMRNCKVFRFYLRNVPISDEGIELFIQAHKKIFTKLTTFEMDVSGTQVSQSLLEQIQALSKLTNTNL